MSIVVSTQPTVEPVSLVEAKLHLRVDNSAEDALITSQIISARQWVENYLKRPLITQTLTLYADVFESHMELTPNLQVVNSIKYLDQNNILQLLPDTNYNVFIRQLVGYVMPADGISWPAVKYQPESVQIEFVAGYGDSVAVHETIKQAILLMVGTSYSQREDHKLETAVKNILSPYRVITF